MTLSMRTVLKAAIEEYSGKRVSSIRWHQDPKVLDTYAIRSKFNGEDENCDWLITRFKLSEPPKEIAVRLDESEFETWPPKSGSLKFFI